MATLKPDKIDVGTSIAIDGSIIITSAGDATFSGDVIVSGNLNVGSTISAVAEGDLAASDGTREFFFDASVGSLTVPELVLGLAGDVFLGRSAAGRLTVGTASGNALGRVDAATFRAGVSVELLDNDELIFGASFDCRSDWSAIQATANQLLMGIRADGTAAGGGALILTELANIGKDHDHAVSSTPSLILHSQTDPDTANDEFVRIFHNVTRPVFQSGSGDFMFSTDGTTVDGVIDLGRINVGSSTATAVADGDLAAGDGTRELRWDASAAQLLIQTTAGTVQEAMSGELIIRSSSGLARIFSYSDTVGNAGQILLGHFGGTIGARTATLDTFALGGFAFQGLDNGGSPGSRRNGALVQAYAVENFTATSSATDLQIRTTPTGTTATVNRLTVHATGGITMGNADAPIATAALGDLVVGDGSNEMFWDASLGSLKLPLVDTQEAINSEIVITGTVPSFRMYAYSSTAGNRATVTLGHFGGSVGARTATLDTYELGGFAFQGLDNAGSPGGRRVGALLTTVAEANWTTTSIPTRFELSTCDTGSITLVNRLTVHATGGITMGNADAPIATAALGDLVVGDGTRELFWDASLGILNLTAGGLEAGSPALTAEVGDLLAGDGTNGYFHWDASIGRLVTSQETAFTSGSSFPFAVVHTSTNTPAAGFISRIALQGHGSTNVTVNMCYINTEWRDPVIAVTPNGQYADFTVDIIRDTVMVEGFRVGNSQAIRGAIRGEFLAGGLMVGTIASLTAAEEGDISAGDGTNEMFWDASVGMLFINRSAAALTPSDELVLAAEDGAACVQRMYTFSNTAGAAPNITMMRYRGTGASPLLLDSGDTIGTLGWQGAWGDALGSINSGASILSATEAVWSSPSTPANLQFNTTVSGTNTLVERMRIHASGGITMGNVAAPVATAALGDLVVGDGVREMFWDASTGALLLDEGFLNVGDNTATFNQGPADAKGEFYVSDNVNGYLFWSGATSQLTCQAFDAGTTNVGLPFVLEHHTSGMAADGFGVGFNYELHSSTGTNRAAGEMSCVWTDATDATRTSDLVIELSRLGAALLVEVGRFRGADYSLRLDGGLEVGGSTGTIGSAGDIIAGDGIREFFWDASVGDLTINQTVATLGTSAALHLVKDAAVDLRMHTFSATPSQAPTLNLVRHKGTGALPTQVVNGDTLGSIVFTGGWTTTPTGINSGALFRSLATGTWTGPSTPAELQFHTTVSGENGATERLRIHDNGGITMGDVAGPVATAALGDLVVGDGVREMFWDASGGTLYLDEGGLNVGDNAATYFVGPADAKGELYVSDGSLGYMYYEPSFGQRLGVSTALTNTTSFAMGFGHTTSGTPAAGFGVGFAMQLESTTTEVRDACYLSTEWAVATDASRDADYVVELAVSGTMTERFRVRGGDGITEAVGLEAGSPTGTAEVGDIFAGDGTNGDFTWDASLGRLVVSQETAFTSGSDFPMAIVHTSTGFPVKGFISRLALQGHGSLNVTANMVYINAEWQDPVFIGGQYADFTIDLVRNNIMTAAFRVGNSLAINGAVRGEFPAAGLMVGTIASLTAAEAGDISAGDATRELFWDASLAVLNLDGAAATIAWDTSLKIGAATSDTLGFYGVTPVAQSSAYTPTNVSTDRAFDADTVVITELADIVGTLIADLQAVGLLG